MKATRIRTLEDQLLYDGAVSAFDALLRSVSEMYGKKVAKKSKKDLQMNDN